MEIYEVHTKSIDGVTRKEIDIREAINHFLNLDRGSLRINIDGLVITIESTHLTVYDSVNERSVVLTVGIIIEGWSVYA